jgi:hypothetical protein
LAWQSPRRCAAGTTGERRNSWNEVTCGNHYARALSSWSLLTALSRYHYSAPDRWLAFAPAEPERG